MKKYSLLLLLLLIPYYTFAEVVDEYPSLKFNLNDDGTCSVGANETNRPSGSLTIPAEVAINGNTYKVTSISWSGFVFSSSLEEVIIPEGVTYINMYAFQDCKSLTTVIIPDGMANLDYDIFHGCSKLSTIIFLGDCPAKISQSSLGIQDGCKVFVPLSKRNDYLPNLTKPTNNKVDPSRIIGYEHYEGDYPDLVFTQISGKEGECSVKKANNGIKGDNGKLVIPSAILKADGYIYNVTTIEAEAFDDCYALTSITIPEGVTEIEHSAFELCASLTSVKIPNSVTSIGPYAFYTCSKLTSVKIPNSVTSIGKRAFSYCWGLKSLIFTGETCPETLGTDILYYSGKCTVYVPEGAVDAYLKPLDDAGVDASRVKGYVEESACKELVFEPISSKDGEYSVKKANNEIKGDNGKLVIPSAILKADGNIYNVTTLEADAFGWCTSLTSVEIPSSVTSIETDAFAYCSKLTSVDIPSSVTSIGDRAFSFCGALTSVEIPLSVISIGMYTFAGCYAFTSVEIPSSVTSIGEYPFAYCRQLKTLIFMGENCPETFGKDILNGADNCTVYVPEASVDDYKLNLLNVDASRVKGYVEESACEELVFTSIEGKNGECSVKKANDDITGDNGKLVIPSAILTDDGNIYNVTALEDNAFLNCIGITSVVIPDELKGISDYAFESCDNLESVILPDGIETIGSFAFYSTALTKVDLPASIREIGAYSFSSCEQLKSITLPEELQKIENNAFDDCIAMENIDIPNSVKEMGERMFMGCVKLRSVKFPASITTIEGLMFYNCSALTSVTVPASVTSISGDVFRGCSGLKSLIFMGTACPDIVTGENYKGLLNETPDECTVYVVNKTVVSEYEGKFGTHTVKPLLDITTETGMYVKTGDSYNIELTSYPDGYAPEGLSYSVKEEGVTLTEGEDAFTLTGHGAATVRVADAGNENIYAETTLNVYMSGDSNDNGTVDITDAVTTANYIVGKEPEKFLEIAADVVPSDPSAITIADVVATVDIMLAAPAPEPSDDSKALMAPANSVDFLTLRAALEGIALSLAGQGVFSALQADVTLPVGATLNGVHAGDRLTGNHSVMYRMVDDRTVRVAVFALSLDTFVHGDAVVILDVYGMGTGDVTAANVIASDADGNGYRLGVDGGGMTGIEGVVPGKGAVVSGVDGGIAVTGAAGMTVAVYTMDGRLVKSFTAGDDDRVTMDLVPGVYLVRVGAAPAVKIAVR